MIVFYVSGHGFGHASRDIELVNALGRRRPDLPVTIRTSAPRWFFDLSLTRPVEWAPRECDPGVAQIDSLQVDEAATVQRATEFFASLDEDAAAEAAWLRSAGARLVVGDIPPLAFAAAARAGLPSVAVGNFTWDWIYEGYRPWMADGTRLVERVREAYRHAVLAVRLPMHGGFDMFGRVVDVPFIARRSRRPPAATREALGLPGNRPLVLLSFGGYGLQRIDLARAAASGRFTVVVTSDVTASRRGDRMPETSGAAVPAGVRLVDEGALYPAGLRYEDLLAAVDVVITKPGYGIVAECAANGTAMLYTSRGRFVEYDVLVREMPRWLRTGFISNDDLLAGRWDDAIAAVVSGPAPPETADVGGAERAADLVLQHIDAAAGR